jgi:hypothetical protein
MFKRKIWEERNMEDKNGQIKTNLKEILKIWKDHYARMFERENKTQKEEKESEDQKQEQGDRIGSEDEGISIIEVEIALQKLNWERQQELMKFTQR